MANCRSNSNELTDHGKGSFDIVNLKNLSPLLDETLDEEVEIFNMTSLNTLMFLNQNDNRTIRSSSADHLTDICHDEGEKFRLSLAYERMQVMPAILVQELAPYVRHLDISHNEFQNIDFLQHFTELNSVICDHNKITCKTHIPYMPKVELLWMNHCKIVHLYPWIKMLHDACPNLKYLSLMGNPAAPSYLNGGNFYEYLQYRLFVISLFPWLIHLDDRLVTEDQRNEAARLYKKPLLDRMLTASTKHIPEYFRNFSEKMSQAINCIPSLTYQHQESSRNIII